MKIKLLLIECGEADRFCAIRDSLVRVITFCNASPHEKKSYEEKINEILQQKKVTKIDIELIIYYLVKAAEIIGNTLSYSFSQLWREQQNRRELDESMLISTYKDMRDMFDMMCYLINRLMGFDGTHDEKDLKQIFAPLAIDKYGYRMNPRLLEQVKIEISIMARDPRSANLFTWRHIRTLASDKDSTFKLRFFSHIVAQGARDENSLFSKLPMELNTRIATYAAESDPDDGSILNTACGFFGRPQTEPPIPTHDSCSVM